LIAAGASIQETAQQLGHSTIAQVVGTYSRFTHPPQSALKLEQFVGSRERRAMQKLPDLIEAQTKKSLLEALAKTQGNVSHAAGRYPAFRVIQSIA